MALAPCIDEVNLLSASVWPGRLAAEVLVSGCPWRCRHCSSPELQVRRHRLDWEAVLAALECRRGWLEGVVFSGGEPLSEPCLAEMMTAVASLGYAVGLRTAGAYPRQLALLLPQLDWVALSIKTLPPAYGELTGRRYSAAAAWSSLELLLQWSGDFECCTVWSPLWLTESMLVDLAQELAARGVQNYAVQGYRRDAGLAVDVLGAETQDFLRQLFQKYHWR